MLRQWAALAAAALLLAIATAQDPQPPLTMQKFLAKYNPLMDRLQASEGGETPANIFAGLDENHNGAIDGQELRVLSEKVAAALKSQRAAPDATAAKTSGRGGGRKRTLSPELDALIEQAAGSGEAGVSVAQFMEFWSSQGHAEEMGKDGFRLFKELDLDKSGALSAEELTGYKSLLYTGRTHADRAGERTWQDHESRDPRKAPPSKGLGEAGGKDLTFAEFEERYRDQVTNEKQPHGHHRAFIALDRNQDNFIQPHELNALDRWIRSHPDL